MSSLALKAVSGISGNVDLQICLPTMKSSLHNTISGLYHVPHTRLPLFVRVDMEDFHLFILRYSNIQLNLTNVKELRLNFVYSIMEYTFLDEVTEEYCTHFYMKLQKDTVYISIGSYRSILYTFQ